MKWLSAGLTFVNFATLCGLLLGMIAGGLGRGTAILSICLGGAAAVLAYVTTRDPESTRTSENKGTPRGLRKYKAIWLWVAAACFAIFAIRSFCWLLFIDGDQLRIQSPNN